MSYCSFDVLISSNFELQVFIVTDIHSYLVIWSVSDPIPLWFTWDRSCEWCMTLAIKLPLSVEIHDINLDKAIRGPASDTEVKPGPIIWNRKTGQSEKEHIDYII